MGSQAYKPPYVEWYESDFWSIKVRRLRPLARLMYRSLLQQSTQWDRPGYLPKTDVELAFLADAPDAQTWDIYRDEVMAMFAITEDGYYYHERCLASIEKAQKKSESGQRAAAKRWDSGGKAPAERGQSQPEPDPEPDPKPEPKPEPKKPARDETPDGLHPREYALRLLEDLRLPATRPMLEVVARTIEAQGLPPPKAFEMLRFQAFQAQTNGVNVDRFWFENGKYRGNGDGQQRVSSAEQRASQIRERTAAAEDRARKAAGEFSDHDAPV